MTKKIKGASKGKNIGKRTIKAKSSSGARVGATSAFNLKVPATLAKKLGLVAQNDSSFKGSNPQRYAMNLIKTAASQKTAEKV